MAIDDHPVLRRHGVSAVLRIAILYALFVIVVICSLSSKSGCGDQSRSARTRQGGRVDVDPTETEFLTTYPFGSKFLPPATPYTEEEARNTTRRRKRLSRLDRTGLPSPLRTRIDD